MRRIAIISLLSALLWSCGSNNSGYEPVTIHRLDRALASGRVEAVDSMRDAAEALFAVTGRGEVDAQSVADYAADRATIFYMPDIEQRLPSLDSVQSVLGRVYAILAEKLPKAPRYEIYGIVLPYNQSLFFKDSMLFVGLNHYLGADYEPYGHFPEFIRRDKQAARLPVDVAEAAVEVGYPFSPETAYPTVLNRILYEGAVIEAVMQVTGVDEATALGYTPDQWQWMNTNEHQAWDALITRNFLYSTDPAHARSLTAPAPHTTLLNPGSPGQAGRFIGHKIVSSYLRENSSATLAGILSPDFYMNPATLEKSGYRP